MRSPTEPRELDSRYGDGLRVTLLWYPETNRVVVEVYDDDAQQMFEIEVPRVCAWDAFRNPYAYAPPGALARKAGTAAPVWVRPSGTRCRQRRA